MNSINIPSITTNTITGQLIKSSHHSMNDIYESIPIDYEIENLVIIHRHGDRSQISKQLGRNCPERLDLYEQWNNKLPNEKDLQAMICVARTDDLDKEVFPEEIYSNMISYLYTGWDKDNIPYGQLTDIGVKQMKHLGVTLRKRYQELVKISNDNLVLRSTNSCRTIQSLRSLLIGLLFNSEKEMEETLQLQQSGLSRLSLPIICVRPKHQETLFPNADGQCLKMTQRRDELLRNNPITSSIEKQEFKLFEERISRDLGYDAPYVPWLSIKEVTTCHLVHEIETYHQLSHEDELKLTQISARIWGILYNVSNNININSFLINSFHLLRINQ